MPGPGGSGIWGIGCLAYWAFIAGISTGVYIYIYIEREREMCVVCLDPGSCRHLVPLLGISAYLVLGSLFTLIKVDFIRQAT